MKKYTYRVVCYVDVIAESEEEAIEKAEEQFPYDVDINQITLYEKDDDYEWEQADRFNDERKLGL